MSNSLLNEHLSNCLHCRPESLCSVARSLIGVELSKPKCTVSALLTCTCQHAEAQHDLDATLGEWIELKRSAWNGSPNESYRSVTPFYGVCMVEGCECLRFRPNIIDVALSVATPLYEEDL